MGRCPVWRRYKTARWNGAGKITCRYYNWKKYAGDARWERESNSVNTHLYLASSLTLSFVINFFPKTTKKIVDPSSWSTCRNMKPCKVFRIIRLEDKMETLIFVTLYNRINCEMPFDYYFGASAAMEWIDRYWLMDVDLVWDSFVQLSLCVTLLRVRQGGKFKKQRDFSEEYTQMIDVAKYIFRSDCDRPIVS